jgi:hypothetical protein
MKGQSETAKADRTSMASTKADLRELKNNSSATVQELQEFLRELRGKSPQEMLGVVASSQLFRATILSVLLVTGTLFALTALPYFLGDEPAPAPEPEPLAAAAPAAPVPAPPVTDPKPTDPKNPVTLAPLGVNEKLPASPNSNPLEDKGGDFLKDLE